MKFFKKSNPDSPKVSVLVPVYNVEKFLPQCLDSLQAQKLKDIEFICVNDGSTDSSLEILKTYAANDPRFVLIDKANSGYGASMNAGLAKAKGEFVGLVESDDFANSNMFSDMYKFASKNNLDLVKSNYYEYENNASIFIEPFEGIRYKAILCPQETRELFLRLPIVWSALYNRNFLVSNKIRFNETPGASYQDTSFTQQCWIAAKRVAVLPKGYLNYRIDNPDSSVKSNAKIFEVCYEYELTEQFISESEDRKYALEMLAPLKTGTYFWNYSRLTDEARLEFAARMIEEFKDLANKNLLSPEFIDPERYEIIQYMLSATSAKEFCEKYNHEI